MNEGGKWCRFRGANLHLQRQAINAYQTALRRGDLVPLPCEACGADAEGHHEDYAEPLAVVWLCRIHHSHRHQGHSLEELFASEAAA